MTKHFVFHTDPGHGWLEVAPVDMLSAGLTEADFSRYSYWSRARGSYFLEEDCDAPKFLKVWREKFGEPEILTRYVDGTSRIRGLQSIHEAV